MKKLLLSLMACSLMSIACESGNFHRDDCSRDDFGRLLPNGILMCCGERIGTWYGTQDGNPGDLFKIVDQYFTNESNDTCFDIQCCREPGQKKGWGFKLTCRREPFIIFSSLRKRLERKAVQKFFKKQNIALQSKPTFTEEECALILRQIKKKKKRQLRKLQKDPAYFYDPNECVVHDPRDIIFERNAHLSSLPARPISDNNDDEQEDSFCDESSRDYPCKLLNRSSFEVREINSSDSSSE